MECKCGSKEFVQIWETAGRMKVYVNDLGEETTEQYYGQQSPTKLAIMYCSKCDEEIVVE